MKVATQNFKKELQWAGRFVNNSTRAIPILQNVLLHAERGKLKIIGTDLEMAGTTEVSGSGGKGWKITVPAKFTLKYLSKVTDDEVELEPWVEHNRLVIKHGDGASARIEGMGHESYPELPKLETTARLSGLDKAIPRAIFAISAEESRFTLNGALFEADGDGARLVSTDGHRVSCAPVEFKGDPMRALIPRKCLAELKELGEDEVSFGYNADHLVFTNGLREILCRKLTGEFPDYHRVLPREYPHHIQVDASALLKVLDRVNVMADERSHGVRLIVGGNKLTVKAEVCEGGRGEGQVPVLGGDNIVPIEAGINCFYAMDVLRLLEGQTVAFGYSNAQSCFGFLAGDGWINATMPLRM
jgi:DNA polymerase-3 subunit beta